jgi:acylaminoacyl-peptidase
LKRTAFALALCAAAAYSAQLPFSLDDLWAWRSISDPRITPDGRWVVYVEGWNDRVSEARRANLWLVSTDGSEKRRLTTGDWQDSSPSWSPEGDRLAWTSDRGGGSRIYVKTLAGISHTPPSDVAQTLVSAVSRLVSTPVRVSDKVSSPSVGMSADAAGRSACATSQPSGCEKAGLDAGPETAIAVAGPVASLAWSPDGKWIAFISIKARAHIFVVPSSGGAARQVSTGDFDDGPPAWMPDGQWILTARTGAGIYAFPTAGGEARPLTPPGNYEDPLPSPDGAKIAYLARDPKPQAYVVRKLYVMNADGGRSHALSGALDRDVFDPQWSADSRTVYFLADDAGATPVYAARADGSLRQVTDAPERLSDLSVAANGRAAAVRSTVSGGDVVFAFSVFDSAARATLAAPNTELLASREIAQPQEIRYQSAGRSVQAWLYKPGPTKKYPLLVDALDALRKMYGFEFNLRAQILAARGFIVLCANPRGTPGYGEDFGNLLRTRAPGDDLDDLLSGVDSVIAKGDADPQRVSIAGGLPAAWALGHSDRFASIIARRAKAWLEEPWDPRRSPILSAANFKTPALVIADAYDPQSDQLFEALQASKAESALVRLPGSQPGAIVMELKAILDWLAKW